MRPGGVARRILLGLGLGAATSVLLMIAWLGLRPDLAVAVATGMFWVKLAYTVLTGLFLAGALTGCRGRGGRVGAFAIAIAAPLAVLAVMAAVRLMRADPEMRMPLMMGRLGQRLPVADLHHRPAGAGGRRLGDAGPRAHPG